MKPMKRFLEFKDCPVLVLSDKQLRELRDDKANWKEITPKDHKGPLEKVS